jgi:hypothetical protein
MRRLIGVAALVLLFSNAPLLIGQAVAVPTATEQSLPQCAPSEAAPNGDRDPLCDGLGQDSPAGSSAPTAQNSSAATSTVSKSGTAVAKKYVPYDRLITGPDGQGCVTTGYVEQGVQPTDAVPPDPSKQDVVAAHSNVVAEYPPCPQQPSQPGQPGATGPTETPSLVAARYWEHVPLPKPQPSIAPGRAITGKLAYLETSGKTADVYTNDTSFGSLRIQAKGAYTIDWGDGTTSGPYSFEGQQWPDGRITHQYLKVGSYDVVVIEKWTATWSLGGEAGVLRTLQSSGRLDNFPVEQIQAVIGR